MRDRRNTTRLPEIPILHRRMHEGLLILLFTTGFFLLLSLLTYHRIDPSFSHQVDSDVVLNKGGRVGAWLSDFLLYLFGYAGFLIPVLLFRTVWNSYCDYRREENITEIEWPRFSLKVAGLFLCTLGATNLFYLYLPPSQALLPYASGGIIGVAMGNALLAGFNRAGATLISFPMILIGITMFSGASWFSIVDKIGAFFIYLIHRAREPKPLKPQIAIPKRRIFRLPFRLPAFLAYLSPFRDKTVIEGKVEPRM